MCRLLTTVMAAILVTAVGASPVLAATSPAWRGVYLSNAAPGNLLLGVAAPAKNDAWAVGEYEQQPGPIIVHWNGRRWLHVTVPGAGPAFEPASVYATSPTDVWIFGSIWSSGVDEVLHFYGRGWRILQLPINSGGTNETAVIGPRSVWIISAAICIAPCSTAASYWNGRFWASYRVNRDLWGIAAGAKTLFGIAVSAFRPADQSFVPVLYERALHNWRLLGPAGQRLTNPLLAASSPRDAWIWGHLTSRGNPGVLYHWNGTCLQQVPVPAGLLTTDILAPDGRGGAWAGPFAHWTGRKWISLRADARRLGQSLAALAPVPGTGSTWLVGGLAWHKRNESFVAVNGKTPR